ncbi:hypothetical protein [Caballeronia zhejiangensis]|uniref:hypothetical protein n=1 Tax=Caballeronia zhejiangensis TaxID=871203 RepID=UPI001F51FCF8|nr:hypothetical protein [Caballeronia zhejiangensis]MCI1046959.1 hypothetical protein [Caballeronia zhejiangensis]
MDILKFEAELEVLRATNSKLIQETAKIATERQWMPFVWGATSASLVIGAIVSLSLLFAKMLH